MPPVTRAALRSNSSVDNNNNHPTTNAAAVISETASKRPVLGELAGNSEIAIASNDLPIQVSPKKTTAQRDGAKKGKGNTAPGKGNSKTETAIAGNTVAVLRQEENNPMLEKEVIGNSEAIDEIPEALLGEGHQKGLLPMSEQPQLANVHSPAGQVTESRLSPSQHKTPKFDPDVHISPLTDNMTEDMEDSFVKSIVSRSPRRLAEDDYSLSPIRQAPRIEDSVEAIDALEDALEQIGQALPDVDTGFDSPVRGPSPTEPVRNVEVGKRVNKPVAGTTRAPSTRNRRAEPKNQASNSRAPSTQRRTATSKPPPQVSRNPSRLTNRPQAGRSPVRTAPTGKPEKASAVASTRTKQASKPTSTSTTQESKTPITRKERPRLDPSNLSTSKPGFVPAKSTKAPTRSTFELPGEAISRRMKAQREEKARQEEEEKQRRRSFKAKPMRINSVPSVAVKETASSRNRARASLIGEDFAREAAAQNSPPVSKRHSAIITPTRSSSFQSVESPASKRNSLLGISKRPSLNSLATRTSSVSRERGVNSPTISVSHAGSEVDRNGEAVTPTRRASTITPADTVYQKARGKEIFQRDQLQKEQRDRERREKEEAAKRARAEAAERGRQASREWAERQRLRKAGK
ncbi:hypothetical protein FQN54_007301 [Arachnomyces sp. PD_36]|nr:hypothetical protein FQN54_007301 [Arachnomyces sp. PD_36]